MHTGFPNEKVTAAVGILLWNDTDYTIEALPPFLEGSILFQGPQNISSKTSITVENIQPLTLYVAVNSNRDGGLSSTLPLEGWTLADGNVTFKGINGLEYMDQIWTKNVTTSASGFTDTIFTTTKDGLTPAIFFKNGKQLYLFAFEGNNIDANIIIRRWPK